MKYKRNTKNYQLMLTISIIGFVSCLTLYYFINTTFLIPLLISTWLCGSIMNRLFYDSVIEHARKIGYGEDGESD